MLYFCFCGKIGLHFLPFNKVWCFQKACEKIKVRNRVMGVKLSSESCEQHQSHRICARFIISFKERITY